MNSRAEISFTVKKVCCDSPNMWSKIQQILFNKLVLTRRMQRSKLPQQLKEVLEVSKYLTLYLVKSDLPKYFQFVDPIGNVFKVTIDTSVCCSCIPGNKDHCMHTFYVLSKIYNVGQDDPRIWQQHYSQQDLKQIFDGARQKKSPNITIQPAIKKIEIGQKKQQVAKQTFKKEEIKSRKTHQKIESQNPLNKKANSEIPTQISLYEQLRVEQNSVCSICYEALRNDTPLVKCPSQCFNYFHCKCLKFWTDYQKKQEANASCPMCRAQLPTNLTDVLKCAERDFVKFYQSFEVNCCECKQEIKFKLFRCLLCKQSNVCVNCYFSWKHLNHDRYLMKKSKRSDWSLPQIRTHGSMAKLDVSLKYMKQFKSYQQMKDRFGQNYSKFLQANMKKETVLQYILNSFVSVTKEIYKTYKKLDFDEKDTKCILCKKGKLTQMRRLNCKHFIDQKCLTFLLVNGQRSCPMDKCFFLEAFQDIKVVIAKK